MVAPCSRIPYSSRHQDTTVKRTQFDLLANAGGWSVEIKALQLAMCLTDEALQCLLLLSPEDRGDYEALVGSLKRRFGQCVEPGLLHSELCYRHRRPGETLRALANDIESLSCRAYAHMPPSVQSSGSVSPGPFPCRPMHTHPAGPPTDFTKGPGNGYREGAGVGRSHGQPSHSADGEIYGEER